MQPETDVHRHADGTIDVDFYRRWASRARRRACGDFIRRCLASIMPNEDIPAASETRKLDTNYLAVAALAFSNRG